MLISRLIISSAVGVESIFSSSFTRPNEFIFQVYILCVTVNIKWSIEIDMNKLSTSERATDQDENKRLYANCGSKPGFTRG
jgi:hypothetical protein